MTRRRVRLATLLTAVVGPRCATVEPIDRTRVAVDVGVNRAGHASYGCEEGELLNRQIHSQQAVQVRLDQTTRWGPAAGIATGLALGRLESGEGFEYGIAFSGLTRPLVRADPSRLTRLQMGSLQKDFDQSVRVWLQLPREDGFHLRLSGVAAQQYGLSVGLARDL